MNDRPPAATPVAQERQHAIFGPGIVAPAEPGVKDAFLLINDDQCRVFLKLHARSSHARSVDFLHFNIGPGQWQAIECKRDLGQNLK